MQKPKSLEQIANELAAKREPIKMEPKPKNTGGIDLSRAAGVTKPAQNTAGNSRIPQGTKPAQNTAGNSRIPQNSVGNSRIPQGTKPAQTSTGNSRIPQGTNSKIPQNSAGNSRIPQSSQKPPVSPKPEPKPEQKPEPEKIIIKPKITTFRDDISALYETPVQNLSPASLFIALGIAFLVMIATLPKVFIANEIYYTSRDIGTLRDKLGVLNEENRELKSKLEQIRYQNQVIDNLR